VVSSTDQAGVPPGWSFPSVLPGAVLDGHVNMFTHFFDCLRTGEKSQSEGVVGRDVMAAVEAAVLSAESGRRETIATMARSSQKLETV
jgi:hypothetical protein